MMPILKPFLIHTKTFQSYPTIVIGMDLGRAHKIILKFELEPSSHLNMCACVYITNCDIFVMHKYILFKILKDYPLKSMINKQHEL